MNPWHFANCTYLYVPITEQSYVTADTVELGTYEMSLPRYPGPRTRTFPRATREETSHRCCGAFRFAPRVDGLPTYVADSFLLAHFCWILVELPSPPKLGSIISQAVGRVPRPPKKSASHDIYCSFSPQYPDGRTSKRFYT